MKNIIIKKILSVVLSLMFIVSLSSSVYAEPLDTVTVKSATYYLNPYDEAVEALDKITEERKIDALINLTDAYGVKAKADPNSDTVATIASGQAVKITGVSQDSGKNIWYQIEYNYLEDTITGFIEREYLVSADERLIEWNDTYVRSRLRSMLRTRSISSADVEQFPESYQDSLYSLKEKHPNWTFVKMYTGIDWNNAVTQECSKDRNLIQARYAQASWMNGMYDSSWAYCSQDIIKYYLDPRNFFDEVYVFQFEHLVYNESIHSENTTQLVINNTFMKSFVPGTSKTYASVFMEAGRTDKISPILLASRVRQEQGAGTSPLISGTYSGYEGLYNYYNIGASGKTTEAVVTSGLLKAREMGWTTRESSLIGGAYFLSKNYINRGQDTLYLQKFDVDYSDGTLYTHQYMQNLQAPASEAKSTFNAYNQNGLITSAPFVFRIPVYNNLPSYAVTKPGSKEVLTMSPTDITNLPVDETAVLNTYLNGSINTAVEMEFLSSDTNVATVDSKGVITGISPGTATITCKRKENPEYANDVTAKVSVIKADISLSDITSPDMEEIIYNPNATLADISLPDGYSWVDKSLIPTVENQGYSVIYNPDNSKYNSITFTLPLTVKKAQIPQDDIKIPEGLEITAGEELNTVALPQGFSWEEPNQLLPKKIGVYTYKATYYTDTLNYEPATGLSIPVRVICTSHEFEEWTGTHADCMHDGTLTRSCSICGQKETVEEKALGHKYTSEVTTKPTETKPGIRTFTCERCGDSYTEEIPATGTSHTHSFTSKITKEPSCMETGIMTYTCSCGYSYEETIEALGHNIVNGACTRCDYKEPVLPVHSHSYTLSGTTATCTQAGVNTYTCSCGSSYTEETAALGHDIVNGKCTRCDYVVPTPTAKPTATPTAKPTATPTAKPTATPTAKPTATPTAKVTATPTAKPTATPTATPTAKPTAKPTATPTAKPTATPTAKPTATPTATPTAKPTATLTAAPTVTQEASTPKPAVPTITPVITSNVQTTDKPKTQSSTVNNTEIKNTPTQVAPEESLDVVRINLQNSTVLTADKIGKLKDDEKEIQLMMSDDIMWNIDVSSIQNEDELNVDMAVELGDADIPQNVIDSISEDEPYVLMSLAHDGPFNFDATLSIPVEKQYQGMIANLFYFNEDLERMEFIASARPDQNGYASFNMKHASDYAIVFADSSLETITNDTQTATEPDTIVQEVFNEQNSENVSIENIILIVAVVVLIIVFLFITGLIIKFRKKKHEDYYLDEEDDEMK